MTGGCLLKIRKAISNDAEKIIELVSAMLPVSILARIEKEVLAENIRNGKQVSYVYDDDGEILGHANVFSDSRVGILGNFVVSPSLRGQGIAKKFLCLLEDLGKNLSLTHLASYTLLQHEYSQRLFSNEYIPVGISLSETSPLSPSDELFSHQVLNGEIALCKSLDREVTLSVPYLGGFEENIRRLYRCIGVNITRKENVGEKKSLPLSDYLLVDLRDKESVNQIRNIFNNEYVFLGIQPSGVDGLNILGFASREKVTQLPDNYVTNTLERKEFVRNILFS